jgi:hypothetical protein
MSWTSSLGPPLMNFCYFALYCRLFSHGAVVFSPPQAVVYHLWSRNHRPTASVPASEIPSNQLKHMQHLENQKNFRKNTSQQRVRDMLNGRTHDSTPCSSRCSLGDVRSMTEFEEVLRVCFSTNKVINESMICNVTNLYSYRVCILNSMIV